jgi:CRP-like cAMP-binding protein
MAVSARINAGQAGNRLLDLIPASDFKHLAKALEPVHLPARQVVFRTDDYVEHLYFPVTTIFTLTVGDPAVDGHSMEFTSVGNEGMVGFTALLGVETSLHQVACRTPGASLRLPTQVLTKVMSRRRAVDDIMKRYVAVAYRTAVQAVLCNALHPVEQRVCRWLLATREKAAGEVPATQDALADLLGVKRPTVCVVASSLQKAGVISYHRGAVRILDPTGLEHAACACYRVTKSVYERILER